MINRIYHNLFYLVVGGRPSRSSRNARTYYRLLWGRFAHDSISAVPRIEIVRTRRIDSVAVVICICRMNPCYAGVRIIADLMISVIVRSKLPVGLNSEGIRPDDL